MTLWKDVPKRSWVFWPAQTFSMGVCQNGTYLLSENMKIVSKRISELPFFSTYAFERTFENEQISSNVNFLVEFH